MDEVMVSATKWQQGGGGVCIFCVCMSSHAAAAVAQERMHTITTIT